MWKYWKILVAQRRQHSGAVYPIAPLHWVCCEHEMPSGEVDKIFVCVFGVFLLLFCYVRVYFWLVWVPFGLHKWGMDNSVILDQQLLKLNFLLFNWILSFQDNHRKKIYCWIKCVYFIVHFDIKFHGCRLHGLGVGGLDGLPTPPSTWLTMTKDIVEGSQHDWQLSRSI